MCGRGQSQLRSKQSTRTWSIAAAPMSPVSTGQPQKKMRVASSVTLDHASPARERFWTSAPAKVWRPLRQFAGDSEYELASRAPMLAGNLQNGWGLNRIRHSLLRNTRNEVAIFSMPRCYLMYSNTFWISTSSSRIWASL